MEHNFSTILYVTWQVLVCATFAIGWVKLNLRSVHCGKVVCLTPNAYYCPSRAMMPQQLAPSVPYQSNVSQSQTQILIYVSPIYNQSNVICVNRSV